MANRARPGTKTARRPPAAAAPPAGDRKPFSWTAVAVANLLILGAVAVAACIKGYSSDLYYATVQEDEILEWGTFWAFILAAVAAAVAAGRQRRATGRLPWFLAGMSLFCFVFAMEEISWAQRVLGYRPPAYFLEENFQQELNVHNVISTGLRKLILKGIILGYGVALALLALVPAVRRRLEAAAIVAPPAALAPGFVAAYLLYEAYPWTHSGEWVELMLGFGFLFALIHNARRLRSGAPRPGLWRRSEVVVAGAALLAMALGTANAMVSRHLRAASPEQLAAARGELEALKRDFESGRAKTRCNRHRRLYTFVEKYDQDGLNAGEFAGLTARGLPPERASFFLDPWNSPYWIRDWCWDDKRERVVFVYSFGPNRRRESNRREILGDDVGAIIRLDG